jgi:hypothetical protein
MEGSMRNTRKNRFIVLACAFAIVLTACAPVITVYNKTNIDVRVAVFPPGSGMSVVSPSPGESSQVVFSKAGTFTAVAIASQAWVEWAKERRDTLSRMLADPKYLTPALIQKVRQELQQITAKIKQIESMPKNSGDGCSATLQDQDNKDWWGSTVPDGMVTVTMDKSTGKLGVVCAAVSK